MQTHAHTIGVVELVTGCGSRTTWHGGRAPHELACSDKAHTTDPVCAFCIAIAMRRSSLARVMRRTLALAIPTLVTLTAACSDPAEPAKDAADPVTDSEPVTTECPPEEMWRDFQHKPCGQAETYCRAAQCANPCLECFMLVCRAATSTNPQRWELNAQIACPCGDTPPNCVDPVTCDVTPGCK
jgi:hypothetical protein